MFQPDKYKKPDRWGWQPGLVERKWRRATQNLLLFMPMWDASGHDLSPRNRNLTPDFESGAPTGATSTRGRCVDFNGSQSFSTPSSLINVGAPTGEARFTIACVWEHDAFGSGSDQDVLIRRARAAVDGFSFEIDDSLLMGNANHAANSITASNTLTTGVVYAGIFSFDEVKNESRLIYLGDDGSFENILNTTATGAYSDVGSGPSSFVGSRNQGADTLDGRMYILAMWRDYFEEQQCLEWIDDPFGMLRLDEVAVVIVPAVAGAFDTFAKRLCMMNFGE